MRDKPTSFDLNAFLPYRLLAVANRDSRNLAKRYGLEFDVSVVEWRILVHLSYSGEVSVRDIEARVDMERPKISRAVSRLVEAGYISKEVDGGDRRLLSLTLTAEGRKLVRKLLPIAIEYQAGIERKLGPRRLKQLNEALDILLGENEGSNK
jgi:DNA-binding MarR family transcriptional regulator